MLWKRSFEVCLTLICARGFDNMRLSHRHRFVFFALPKAGSSSVRQLLAPYSDIQSVKNFFHRCVENPFYPHITPREAQPLFLSRGWDFDVYHKFAVTRNPWARAVSLYRHVMQAEPDVGDFKSWLHGVRPDGAGGGGGPWERWRRYGAWSASAFLADCNGKCMVDQVIKLEDLQEALPPLLASLGLEGVSASDVPHANTRSLGEDYRPWYDDDSAAWIADRYRLDIERWKYRFDGVAGSYL